MATFPVPRCLAQTAPREPGGRDWIVNLPGIVGTLHAAMVGDTVNDACLLARADVGLAIGAGAVFRHQPWWGKGLIAG